MATRRYARIQRVAERYDVSVPTVWRWVQKGRLPAPEKLSPGCTRFDLDKLDAADSSREAEA